MSCCSTSYTVAVECPGRSSRCRSQRSAYVCSTSVPPRAFGCAVLSGTALRVRSTTTRSTFTPLAGRRFQRQWQVQCSKNDSRSSKSRRPKRGWSPWNFNWIADWQLNLPRLIFNVTAFFLLLRIWPLHGRSPLGTAQPVTVPVPFSEFVRQTDSQQVSAVSIDRRNIKYQLHPDSPVFEDIPQTDEPVAVSFQTVRPSDYAMPYETLVKQGVQFAAVDGRNNTMMTVVESPQTRLSPHHF